MWSVDGCSAHGYTVYYRISGSDKSIVSLMKDATFLSMVFDLSLSRISKFPCLWEIISPSQVTVEQLIGNWLG